ncbi:MAG: uroporphyrinogen decarboxylase family protein [Spirochaetia bacterium]|nr:uroporphyrinogen decarboxylase family protein [Spirochaetia bacterium]
MNVLLNKKDLVIPLMGVNGIPHTGTTVRENLTDAQTQFDTLSTLIERYQPDGIFTMMDLTVEAEALGMQISQEEQETPAVLVHSVADLDDIARVRAQWNGLCGRMPVFVDVVRRLSSACDIIIGAHVIGPFTLAGELMGVNDLTMNTILDPSLVHACLELSVEVITAYTQALFDAGADVVSVLEPTAMMISPSQFEEFSAAPFRQILSQTGDKPLILHICGDTTHLIEAMGATGAAGLSIDWQVDMAACLERIPKDVALIGNLDPVRCFLSSTPQEVRQMVADLRQRLQGHDNVILSSGCDLPLATPEENVTAFMEAARA